MTIFDDILNVVPGASLIQKAVQGKKVDFLDVLPGSKLVVRAVGMSLSIAGELLKPPTSVLPLTQSGSRTSPTEDYGKLEPHIQEDNTMIYIGLGVGSLVVIGAVGYVILKD